MPIQAVDVVVGGIYATENNQERRVTRIEDGKVWYEARGGNVKNDWFSPHGLNNPPSMDTFVEACVRVISRP